MKTVISGPKMPYCSKFWENKNFPKNNKSVPVLHSMMPNMLQSFRKSNEQILSKLRKQSFWAQKCPIALKSFENKKSFFRIDAIFFIIFYIHVSQGQNSLSYIGPAVWNKLPENIKNCTNVNTFKHDI